MRRENHRLQLEFALKSAQSSLAASEFAEASISVAAALDALSAMPVDERASFTNEQRTAYTLRYTARMGLSQFPEAFNDALSLCAAFPRFSIGYFLAGEALRRLQLFSDAANYLARAAAMTGPEKVKAKIVGNAVRTDAHLADARGIVLPTKEELGISVPNPGIFDTVEWGRGISAGLVAAADGSFPSPLVSAQPESVLSDAGASSSTPSAAVTNEADTVRQETCTRSIGDSCGAATRTSQSRGDFVAMIAYLFCVVLVATVGCFGGQTLAVTTAVIAATTLWFAVPRSLAAGGFPLVVPGCASLLGLCLVFS